MYLTISFKQNDIFFCLLLKRFSLRIIVLLQEEVFQEKFAVDGWAGIF